MGADVQRTMLVKAEATLAKIQFDGKSRSFTYVKYISSMRQAFLDLGPEDQYSETRKVNKLLSSFKVPALQHLGSTVRNDQYLSRNFEAAVAFIAGELEALRQVLTADRHASALSSSEKKRKKKTGKSRARRKKEQPPADTDDTPPSPESEVDSHSSTSSEER